MVSEASGRKAPPSKTTPPTKVKKAKASVANSIASSRAGTPAPGKDGAKNPQTRVEADGSETQLCKHCKVFVPKDTHSQHSKLCLREKKKRREREEKVKAEAEAAANGTAGDAEGDADGDGDTVMFGNVRPGTADTKDGTRASTPASKAATADGGSMDGDTGGGAGLTKKALNNLNKKRKAEADNTADSKDKPNKKKKKKANPPAAASTAGSTTTAPAPNTAPDPTATTTGTKLHPTTSNTSTNNPQTQATTGPGGKPRNPVSVERQCGVLLSNGLLCARSLTCKSHSMGAKRAVPGRSAPYDVLLANYQKKNQAKLQRAQFAANAAGGAWDEDAEGGGRVDSDEEREAVMAGVGRCAPRPLVGVEAAVNVNGAGAGGGNGWFGAPVRARYQHVRMKEMLSNALSGNRGGSLFAVVAKDTGMVGDSAAVVDAEGDVASVVGGGSRRQSMQPPSSSTDGARRGSMSAAAVG